MGIYNDSFYEKEGSSALTASQIVMQFIMKTLKCTSVIDFGCGTGEWLMEAKKSGASRIKGLDGEYVRDHLQIDEKEFYGCNLCEKIDIQEKYDLAMSLEVAEHLPPENAEGFVDNIIKCAEVVFFGAAVPHQEGTLHVNEQYPSYWRALFEKRGYVQLDVIRGFFWDDKRIDSFYRQNMFIYCLKEKAAGIKERFGEIPPITDVIQPDLWENKWKQVFYFPYSEVKKDAKVVIFGAGIVGRDFMDQLCGTNYACPVMWCDNNYKVYAGENMEVRGAEEIRDCEFDYVVIALKDEKIAFKIKEQLLGMDIPADKIVWKAPEYFRKYR